MSVSIEKQFRWVHKLGTALWNSSYEMTMHSLNSLSLFACVSLEYDNWVKNVEENAFLIKLLYFRFYRS